MSTPKPCTNGKRHKWEWMHNRVVVSGSGAYRSVSHRGVYLCACGQTKLGVAGHG